MATETETKTPPLTPAEIDRIAARFMRDWHAIAETPFRELCHFTMSDVCDCYSDDDAHCFGDDVSALRAANAVSVEACIRASLVRPEPPGYWVALRVLDERDELLRALYINEEPRALATGSPLAFWTTDAPLGEHTVGELIEMLTASVVSMAAGGRAARDLAMYAYQRSQLARVAAFGIADRMALITYVARCHATGAVSPSAAREAWEGGAS